jgi:hypothetical protein
MDWKDDYGAVDDAVKTSPLVKEAKTIADIAKQAVDFQRLYGGAIRIPGDDAPDNEKADFRAKLERVGLVPKDKFTEFVKPAKAEDYKHDGYIPEGLTVEQRTIDDIKARAHTLGLSNDQFVAMTKAELDGLKAMTQSQAQRNEEANGRLKGEWGQAFDARLKLAEAAAMWGGGEEMRQAVMSQRDPALLAMLAKVGEQLQESGRTDLQRIVPSEPTPGEAQQKLRDIDANKAHPWHKLSSLPKKEQDALLVERMALVSRSLGQKPGRDFLFEEAS